jgi:thiamine transport system permease protein
VRALKLAPSALAGGAALALVGGVVTIAAVGLVSAAGSLPAVPWAYVRGILAFTVLQATLSTAISLVLGAGLALALARRPAFPGRGGVLALLDLAFVLPPVVVIFGVVAVYGNAGYVREITDAVGLSTARWLYGLPGILIGHAVFNAPFCARVFLAALEAVPGEHFRLAEQLGMKPGAIFRLIDRPILLREAPGAGGLVFLLCFTSFPIVLALGGGPGAATLEVAIYEAIMSEADFGRAAVLASVQILCCLALVGVAAVLERRPAEGGEGGWRQPRPDRAALLPRVLDTIAGLAGLAVVAIPVAAVAVSGVPALPRLLDREVLDAAVTSAVIALPAAVLASVLALSLAAFSRHLKLDRASPRWALLPRLAAFAILLVPPIALAAGLFVAARAVTNPFALGAPLIVLVNGLIALPFVLRRVEPPLMLAGERWGRLADGLGIGGLARLRLVDAPLLRAPLSAGFATALALSFGDLGVAAFFGSGRLVTLPVLLYQRLGSYRMDEAAAIALLIGVVTFAAFLLARRLGGGPDADRL